MRDKRTPSLMLLDLDGTLTPVQSPWKYVYERLGIWEAVGRPILDRYQRGMIDYATFCRLDVQAWENAGADLWEVERILDEIPLPKESLDFLEALLESGFLVTLLSTGFQRVADNLTQRTGRVSLRKIRSVINGIRLQEDRLEPILRVHEGNTRRGKGNWAKRLVRFSGVPLERTFAVGDGVSDSFMFAQVGKAFPVKGPHDLQKVLAKLLP